MIGVAARERTPVRITHMTSASLYNHAVRRTLQGQPGIALETDIPYPGLARPQSQMAVPILSAGRLRGVLSVESPEELRFRFEDEDALVAIAGHLGAAIELQRPDTNDAPPAACRLPPAAAAPAPPPRADPFEFGFILRIHAAHGDQNVAHQGPHGLVDADIEVRALGPTAAGLQLFQLTGIGLHAFLPCGPRACGPDDTAAHRERRHEESLEMRRQRS